jgi:hypothetical protein
MDDTCKCKLLFTPPSTGMSIIQHLNMKNCKNLNLEASTDMSYRDNHGTFSVTRRPIP